MELRRLQGRFEDLADAVLCEGNPLDPRVAAVACQLLQGARACIRDGLAAKEQEELIERLEALESALAARKQGFTAMGLRAGLRRVERAAHGQLESFRTKDGRTYVYSVQDAGISLFIYACDLIREPYQPDEPEPEEPPILEAIRNARDPDEVIRRFEGPDPSKQFVDVRLMVYGPDDPRSGYESPVPDLSD